MRLYAVAFITWAATVAVSSDSDVVNLSDEKTVGYAEFRDLPTKQIVQPYVTREAVVEDPSQANTEHRVDDAISDLELSRLATRAENTSEQNDTSANVSPDDEEPIYVTPFTEISERRLFGEHLSGVESSYTIAEDVLLVENAGSFGQRVQQDQGDRMPIRITSKIIDGQQQNDEYRDIRKSLSSTMLPLEEKVNHENIHASTIRGPSLTLTKEESGSLADSLSDDSGATASPTLTRNLDEVLLQSEDATHNSRINSTSTLENDVVPEHFPRPQAKSSQAYNITENIARKPVELAKQKSIENVITSTSVEISPSLQLAKFSGPIVVPELPIRKIQDVAIDYMEDELSETRSLENAGVAARISGRSSKKTPKSITSSSVMLNPLQVGIILTNADEAELVDDSEHSAATDTEDYFGDEPQRLANEQSVQKKENHSNVDYKDETFRHAEEQEERGATEFVTRKTPESTVEIQKSIELYHTAPIQEIHYPVEYVQHSAHLAIETNNLGGAQRSRQPYDQNEEPRPSYDARGNDAVEKPVIKVHTASALSQKHIRQEYNALENDVGKSTVSTLIAGYSSGGRKQTPFESLEPQPLQYNDVKPVLLIANQFDDASYEQSTNVRQYSNDNDDSLYNRPAESTRQEMTSEFVKPNTYQQEQQPVNQPIGHQSFRLPEARRPEPTQLLLKIIPNGSPAEGGFLVPISRPYPIEKIIEKTVHVPHPVEIEKVIEKKVPVPVPQPYPVHVPVDRVVEKRIPQLYPIHIERVIEKRLPYTVQRLLVQPPSYPLHLKLPNIYPTASIEKPVEKPATRPPRPYRADPDYSVSSIEPKYKYLQRPREQVFAGENVDFRDAVFEPHPSQTANASYFYGDLYGRSPLTFDYNIDTGKSYVPAAQVSNIKLMLLPKKFTDHHVLLRPQATASPYATLPVSFRRQIMYNLVEKDKTVKNEYVGPVPPRKAFTSQAKQLFSTSVTQSPATTATLRRARQPETQYLGSFRQSKMEYGFKPPMVPSVQYDENTASKVEN